MQRNSRNLEEKVSLDSIKDRQFQVHYLKTNEDNFILLDFLL